MAKYKCKICGYVFDEDDIEEGLNIPAGTKLEKERTALARIFADPFTYGADAEDSRPR